MNSSTSSSDPHRRFVVWLLTVVLLPMGGLFAAGVYLQPLDGDLTRLGFFAERDFGWNAPQIEFPDTRLDLPSGLMDPGHFGRYHDVLVLGDSFAWGSPKLQWQNYLIAATNWSVATQNINSVRLRDVLGSTVFRDHPPRILIVESVERELIHHLEENDLMCGGAVLAPLTRRGIDADVTVARPLDWEGVLSGRIARVERQIRWRDIKPSYVRNYVADTLVGNLFGSRRSDTVPVRLASPAPLSSANKDALLVYKDDFNKMEGWREAWPKVDCWIDEIRRQVEANGYTRLVLMVAPDKLTAYAEFLDDPEMKNASLLARLADRHPDVIPRLDLNLIAAIRRGEQDVYLPNNTHWGSNGHRVAAETLLGFFDVH